VSGPLALAAAHGLARPATAAATDPAAGRLTARICWTVLAAAALVVIIGTAIHAYTSYRSGRAEVDAQRTLIERGLSPAIAASAFHVDERQLATQLEGLLSLRGVIAARVVEQVGEREAVVAAARPEGRSADVVWRFPLRHTTTHGSVAEVGTLAIEVDYALALAGLRDSVLVGLAINVAVVTSLSLLVILLLEFTIMRHLRTLAQRVGETALDELGQPLALDRAEHPPQRSDELDILLEAWNRMRERIESQIVERSELGARLSQEQKMEALGQLASGVVHDTNNMLTSMQGAIELISHHLPEERPPAIDRLLGAIANACRVMGERNHELLAFARKGSGTMRRFDLHQALARVESLVRFGLPRGLALEVEAQARHHHCVGDPARLETALINLMVNARDAIDRRGCIRVSTADADFTALPQTLQQRPSSRDRRWIVVAVADDGIGMSTAVRERACESFFTTKDSGTGMGLMSVHATAFGMGGEITIDSEPGNGTTVRMWLPATAPGHDEGGESP